MKFLEAIFNRLKVKAQTKPNDNPENYPSSEHTEDMERQRLLDDKQSDGDIITPNLTTHPEEFSVPKGLDQTLPTVDLNRSKEEVLNLRDVGTPFAEQTSNHDIPGSDMRPDRTEHQLKEPRSMDLEEVDQQNHAIALKMSTKGILTIDRKLFMEKYTEIQKKAALARKPLSEYLDEIL